MKEKEKKHQTPIVELKVAKEKVLEKSTNLMEAAKYLVDKKLVPSSFKNTEEIFIAMSVCHSLGFDTFGKMQGALKNMYILNGCVHMFGELPLSLVQRSGFLESLEEFFVDKEGKKISTENKNLNEKPMAAVCKVTRKGYPANEVIVTEADLIMSGGKRNQDGSWNFPQGGNKVSYTWKSYPKIHWRLRARHQALKSFFPDALKGVEVGETYSNLNFSAENKPLVEETPSIAKKYDLTETKKEDKVQPITLSKGEQPQTKEE